MAEGLEPGDVFAGHRIEAVAGRGGMGVVYRARHLALDHVVALKVISPALAQDERFRRRFDGRVADRGLDPPPQRRRDSSRGRGRRAAVRDHGPDRGRRPARAAADLRAPSTRRRRPRIVAEVAAALDAAHATGLVHRDVKPANVLLEGEAEADQRVYLTDFGLARRVEATSGVTATGAFVGTLDYVAPEQIRGDRVDARADVYALGCVLFELLAGIPPFASREDKVAKMYAHLNEEPTRLRVLRPELPAAVDAVAARALAKDPAERFPSAGDLGRAVSAAVEGEPTKVSERSVAIGAAAPGPPDATTTADDGPGEPEAVTVPADSVAAPPPPPAPAAEAERPDWRRRRVLFAGGAAAVAAAVVAVILIPTGGGGDGGGTSGLPPPATLTTADDGDTSNQATVAQAAVPVGRLPVNLAHGRGGLWVTNRRSDTVSLVDGRLANEVAEFAAGSSPEGIDVGDGSIWVASAADDELLRLDPRSGEVSDRIAVGDRPGGVVFAAGDVWVADSGADSVTRVDPDSGETTTIGVGASPYGIAFGDGAVWVSNRGDDSIVRITPVNNNTDDPIAVGDNPKGIAVGGGAVWVANTDDDTVSQVVGGSERKAIQVGAEPRGVVAAFGSVWVTVGGADEVARIDPGRARVAQEIRVGSGPEGITAGPRSVWVADGISNTLTRITP